MGFALGEARRESGVCLSCFSLIPSFCKYNLSILDNVILIFMVFAARFQPSFRRYGAVYGLLRTVLSCAILSERTSIGQNP